MLNFAVMRTLAAIVGSLVVAGCVPYPHAYYGAPKVNGTVLENGVPVAKLSVRLEGSFGRNILTGKTDRDGHFTVGPDKHLSIFIGLYGDPAFRFKLSFMRSSADWVGMEVTGMGHSPKELTVLCDLAVPQRSANTVVFCVEQRP